MIFNNDFKHDLEVGQIYEEKLAILLGKKIEVKRDFGTERTSNVFIEYQSRGKASGISTTEAEYYCIFITDEISILIKTDKLKQLCRPYLKTERDKLGGDSNTSKGILLPISDLLNL